MWWGESLLLDHTAKGTKRSHLREKREVPVDTRGVFVMLRGALPEQHNLVGK